MAFSSLIDDTRRMNAKMIAMGQSVDIQKMPRPKPGSAAMQKATFTPEGSDLEKMLYPKNFKPRAYEAEPAMKIETVEQKESQEMIAEIGEQAKEPAKIIGDDAIVTAPKFSSESSAPRPTSGPAWQRCKNYKAQGERAFCKEYLGWCAKERCSRPQL